MAYRVDERRLTPEGIQARCRSCGAILRIRVRKRDPDGTAVASDENMAFPEAPPALERAGEKETSVGTVRKPDEAEYRYCITCGKPLDRSIPAGMNPLCSDCDARQAVCHRRKNPFRRDPVRAHPGRRIRLILLVILVLFLSALLGYRLAQGVTTPLFSGGEQMKGASSVGEMVYRESEREERS